MGYNNYEIGLLTIGLLKLVTFLTFLGLYVVRINKLDKMASNTIQKDRSLKFRVTGVSILIFLDVVHIILSYSDPYYFMSAPYANFSLVSILQILDLILQIYIITREYKKKTRRSRSVLMLWIMMATQQISTIVIVQVYNTNIGIILSIIKLIVNVVLIVLTLLIQSPQPNTLQTFNQNTRQSNLLPILSSTNSVYSKNNQNIYIEFNKQFQVTIEKDHYQFSFKIAVYVCGKFHIITKSEMEFAQLSKDMGQLFPNLEIVILPNVTKTKNIINITKYGQEKQKIYQQYLFNITKTNQFYAEPLMNFLQIPATQRTQLQKHKGSLLKKNTMNSDQQQKSKKPFFTVGWKDQKIYISNPQILDLFVNKNNNQIITFHNRLVIQKRLTIQLLSQTPDQNQLAHFIFRVVNSKSLWKSFAEWMCLGSAIQQKIYNMFQFWNFGFENLEISVIGHETSFDKNKSVIYLYLISIQNKNTHQQGILIKKRFNDFAKLDQNIRKYIASENMKNTNLPSLPPRFSPFQNKTSPNSRRVYFDGYLKNITKIQGINHCIKLLQFLEMDTQVLENTYQEKDKKSRQNSQIFESIHVEQLELEK